ncbi:MAG: hypothetical protein ABIP06_01070, partial [Pyrinomonadaceae bacterium]
KANEEITKVEKDNSKISLVTDRYGNTIETRTFNEDPQLAQIVLQTSADGKIKVFVYGQNGDVKSVPENMLDKIMTAPANEIASAAGISVARRESFPTFAQNQTLPNEAPLKPLPSSNFPIRPREITQVPVEQSKEEEITENEDGPPNRDK